MKPWYQSKTMIFNLATIALGTAEQVAGTGLLGAHGDTALQILGVANMILRAATNTGIGSR